MGFSALYIHTSQVLHWCEQVIWYDFLFTIATLEFATVGSKQINTKSHNLPAELIYDTILIDRNLQNEGNVF